MCKVCTEAVHSVALWTRVTSLVWTCVKYVPKQSIPWHLENVPFYTYGFQSVSKNNCLFGLISVALEALDSSCCKLTTAILLYSVKMCKVWSHGLICSWAPRKAQVWRTWCGWTARPGKYQPGFFSTAYGSKKWQAATVCKELDAIRFVFNAL